MFTKIEKLLTTNYQTADGSQIEMYAQAVGWQARFGSAAAHFQGALLMVVPQKVMVQEQDRRYEVLLLNPAEAAQRTLLPGAIAISTVCWLIMLITKRFLATNHDT